MSATDELCKLLDEHGVEYTTNKSDVYGFEVNTTGGENIVFVSETQVKNFSNPRISHQRRL